MASRNFNPFPVLKTKRLTLRQLLNSDDNEIFSLRSNDSVNKYLGRKPARSIQDAKTFIQTINENIERNDSIYWAITLTGKDILIGTICLFGFSDDNLKAEIGYELLPDFQANGITKEAASEVIRFGFQDLGLKAIEAYTHCENEGSTKLLEKLNFEPDGRDGEKFIIFKLIRNINEV